eukprot:maker-scaffold17_size721972-snap-gene-1.19 protein:Tk09956 transcript:maker-scaffold17_size721972-snap-gene-1.19-mRNA-1 annotation:"contactin-1 isoform x1"
MWLILAQFWLGLLSSPLVISSEFPDRPTVWSVPPPASEHTQWADQGWNVTLECQGAGNRPIAWSYHQAGETPPAASRPHLQPLPNGSLALHGLTEADARSYTCQDMESNESLHTVHLHVRTVPPAVTNLSVVAHSVYALVTWLAPGHGGAPLNGFWLRFRRDKSHLSEADERALAIDELLSYQWSDAPAIGPQATGHTVYGLAPNSTYFFRVCARNRLGCGHNVSVMADTSYVESEVDAAKELMAEEHKSQSYFQIWALALGLIGVTCLILVLGISLVLLRNCDRGRRSSTCEEYFQATEEEAMELVPHITLNPSFNIDMLEFIEPDASSANRVSSNPDVIEHDCLMDRDHDESDEINLVNSPLKRNSRPNG